MRWLVLACLTCCYAPAPAQDCVVACDRDGSCPDDLVCDPAAQACHGSGVASCSEVTPPGETCVGTFLRACATFDHAISLAGDEQLLIDTDTACDAKLRQSDGSQVCVQFGSTITIDEPVLLSGSLPFAFVARDALAVTEQGAVLFSGTVRPPDGACGNAPTGGGGGGAGGSFASSGGSGGGGFADASSGAIALPAMDRPEVLRAGCPGGAGGEKPAGPEVAGAGGGILLAAGMTITLTGTVQAQGTGGPGAIAAGGGGSGGSSGGMIVIDATSIDFGARLLYAAGGGGGSGGNSSGGGMPGGVPGGDLAGPGAVSTGAGGSGGDGAGAAPTEARPGVPGISDGGGGGGGGGAGWIFSVP